MNGQLNQYITPYHLSLRLPLKGVDILILNFGLVKSWFELESVWVREFNPNTKQTLVRTESNQIIQIVWFLI